MWIRYSLLLVSCWLSGSVAAAGLWQAGPPAAPADLVVDPQMVICNADQLPADAHDTEQNVVLQAAEPIYIGGARYALTQAQLTASFGEFMGPCNHLYRWFKGYQLEIPVYGDYGEHLFFDISGRASAELNLTVSCGNFSASDRGSKFVIAQTEATRHSCQSLKLVFSGNHASPPEVNLIIAITEQIPVN